MRMSILFSGLFWGVFLVLLGSSVVLKAVFHIDIPVFRSFFGLFLVLLGVQVLLGRPLLGERSGHKALFSESKFSSPVAGGKYEVLFGKGVLDLATWSAPQEDVTLKLDAVFGHCELRLNPAVPTELELNAAFSGASFPDGSVISFGRHLYRNAAWSKDKPCLRIKADVVFGGLDVKG
jgi:hypothetical protein